MIAEAVSPREWFRANSPFAKVSQEVRELLDYAPDEFRQAFLSGTEANCEVMEIGEGPVRGDGGWEFWRVTLEAHTDEREVFAEIYVGVDGDYDVDWSGPWGSPEVKAQVARYQERISWRDYFQWVLANGDDPLKAIYIPPDTKVPVEWVVRFTPEGDRLKIEGMRMITSEKPSPPAIYWPELSAKKSDPVWREAIEYCELDEDGYTKSTQEEILSNSTGDQKAYVDAKGRLSVRFKTEHQKKRSAAYVKRYRDRYIRKWLARNP